MMKRPFISWTLFLVLLGFFSACATTSTRDGSSHMDQARAHFNGGRYEKAIPILSQLLLYGENNPEQRARAYFMRGECHLMGRSHSQARLDFKAAAQEAGRAKDTMLRGNHFIMECEMKIGDTYACSRVYRSADKAYQGLLDQFPPAKLKDCLLYRRYLCAKKLYHPNPSQYLHKIKNMRSFDSSSLQRMFLENGLKTQSPSLVKKAAPPKPAPIAHDLNSLNVLSRSKWRARSTRSNHDPMTSITKITVHHTSNIVNTLDYGGCAALMRAYQKNHQNSRGWADIGYHFIIDRAGRIWEGRPLKYQGAHAGNSEKNKGNIGVSLMGDFCEQTLTRAQEKTLTRLLTTLCGVYNLHPNSGAIFTHKELHPTNCPGENLQDFVDEYRKSHRL